MQNRDNLNYNSIENDQHNMEEETLESSIDNDNENSNENGNELKNNDGINAEYNNEINENYSIIENNDNQQSIVKNDEYFLKKIEELCNNLMYLLEQNPGNIELFKVTNTLIDIIVDWRVTNGKQYCLPQKIMDTILESMFTVL